MVALVRILVVTDDGLANGGFLQWYDQAMPDAIGDNSREFHLGEFIKVLNETKWVGFHIEITKAHRATPASVGLTEAALKADRGADVVNFRFDQPFSVGGTSRTISDYDMILFFPIAYGNPNPALQAEADAIATFMENGGGFFATGDHANLGAPLAGLIPRVRSMRRWYFSGPLDEESPPGPAGELPAPPPLGFHRHDTTQRGLDNIGQFEDQSDEIPQEITPTLYNAGFTTKTGYLAKKYFPHPLLCSPDGMVRYLPDHMHEGTCEVPDALETRTFMLGGVSKREYPDYKPDSPPPGYVPKPLAPEIVATGKVLPGITTPALDPAHTGSSDVAEAISFGVIGAWDGHRVNKGRVVVDSTWHHFFNINLTGDRYLEDDSLASAHLQKLHGFYIPDGKGGRVACDEYKMIMWYYRNIVYWLIPANRTYVIWWETIDQIINHAQLREELGTIGPDDFKNITIEKFNYFGQLADNYFGKARGACAIYLIRVILYKPKIPWWEWIQEWIDIWNPIRENPARDAISQAELLGALGIAPRLDLVMRLSLGAAVVTMASLRRERQQNVTEVAEKQFARVLEHVQRQLSQALEEGQHVMREWENRLGRDANRPQQ